MTQSFPTQLLFSERINAFHVDLYASGQWFDTPSRACHVLREALRHTLPRHVQPPTTRRAVPEAWTADSAAATTNTPPPPRLRLELEQACDHEAPYTSSVRVKEDGRFKVHLIVDGARRWCQLIYQFAHELAHVVAYYYERRVRYRHAMQWFEEAMAHAVTLHALYATARARLGGALYREPTTLSAYADEQRGAPAGAAAAAAVDLGALYATHRRLLRDYGRVNGDASRDEQARVASFLLECTPGGLAALIDALPYMNVARGASRHPSLGEYLRAWRGACPRRQQRHTVEWLMEQFGK